MRDRSLATVITVIVAVLLGCPGLAFLCFGIADFIALIYRFDITGSITADYILGAIGLCLGILFLAIVILVAYFLLRTRAETRPPSPIEPPQPSSPIEPPQPPGPIEPPQPPGPVEPPQPPSGEEPIPPPI